MTVLVSDRCLASTVPDISRKGLHVEQAPRRDKGDRSRDDGERENSHPPPDHFLMGGKRFSRETL